MDQGAIIKAWRFRKRYYVLGHERKSYKEDRSTRMTCMIPSSQEYYSIWLEAQRNKLGELESRWKERLAIELEALNSNDYVPSLDNMNGVKPMWFVPLNNSFVELVYIVDLDRGILSINNSIHIKLNKIPLTDKFLLPGPTPDEAVTHRADGPPTTKNHTIKGIRNPVKQEVSCQLDSPVCT